MKTLDSNCRQIDIFDSHLPSLSLSSFNRDGEDSNGTGSSSESIAGAASYFKLLTVDQERKKIVYPDWNKARRYTGSILKCTITRNKDRVYDIEFDDGIRLVNVKEDYIRLLEDPSSGGGGGGGSRSKRNNGGNSSLTGSSLAVRLREGVRVHAKRQWGKTAAVKFFPGRVVRITKAANGGLLYDVEIEGTGQIEMNMIVDDLIMGLSEGQRVEAKRPIVFPLQCTGLSYNSTGNILAASYGRHDLSGWCDSPGSVCCWNISNRAQPQAGSSEVDPATQHILGEPDYILDHNSCLMTVAFHPTVPSLVAAGSFNGEVLVWDLTSHDQVLCISPISEYAHQQPVTEVRWVSLPSGSTNRSKISDDGYILASVGNDGRLLFWSLKNRFAHPVKGMLITREKGASVNRLNPSCMGTSCFYFSGNKSGGSDRGAQWLILGQEDGKVVRCQAERLFNIDITADMLKTIPNPADVFPALSKRAEVQLVANHIGPITAMDFSPFNKYLILTAGSDGKVKLCHLLEHMPVWEAEPSAFQPLGSNAGSQGISSKLANNANANKTVITAVTAVKFSRVRPTVFAVCTTEGYIYVYDLYHNFSVPVLRLEVMTTTGMSITTSASERTRSGKSQRESELVAVTGLTFNGKRKELLTACDWTGKVHVWRLPVSLTRSSTKTTGETEQALWERLGRVHAGDTEDA
eukprot:gene3245-3555_t